MLSITAKCRTLAKELDMMNSMCIDLECALGTCSETELAEKIGKFAREMPEYKILTQERQDALSLIRKVCTKECSTKEALKIVKSARAEIEDTRSRIKF